MERKYKDSGIEWIGKIPETWEVERMKGLFTERNERDCKGRTLLSVSQYYGIRPKSETDMADSHIAQSYDDYKEVYQGDFVMNIMLAWNGSYAVSDYDGMVSPAYCVFKFRKDCCKKYFHYLLRTNGYPNAFKTMSRGVINSRLRLYPEQFYTFPVIIPPISDQQRIADYLDEKCGEIDSLIGLQDQMIEKLKSYKQSIITEAVTKGLNKKAKFIPSGIDWIGEIPEHWAIQRLKTLGWTQNGISQSGDYFGEVFQYPFVNYSDVYKNYSLPYPKGRANSTEKDRKIYSLIEGDVLFTRTSETIEEIGFSSTCIETIPDSVYSGFLIRFRPTSGKLFKGFSKYYFRSQVHRAYFVKQMNIVTRASLGQDLLKNLVVLLPPLDEQHVIAEHLDVKCGEIDKLISTKQLKIEMLKVYRNSIINEAVTGKLQIN